MVFNWILVVKCSEEINHFEFKLSEFERGIKIFSTLLSHNFSTILLDFRKRLSKPGFQHVKFRVRIFQFVASIRSLHSTSVITSVSVVLQVTRQAALKKSILLFIREYWTSRCTSTPAPAVTVSSLWFDGQIPTAHQTSPYRYRVTNFWYVTRARVSSTPSRYGVTIRGNVTSVDPP